MSTGEEEERKGLVTHDQLENLVSELRDEIKVQLRDEIQAQLRAEILKQGGWTEGDPTTPIGDNDALAAFDSGGGGGDGDGDGGGGGGKGLGLEESSSPTPALCSRRNSKSREHRRSGSIGKTTKIMEMSSELEFAEENKETGVLADTLTDTREPQNIPADSYGFLICNQPGNLGWFFGMFIWLLQTLLFVLFLDNISNFGSGGNIFNVPANVDPAVRTTQVFAILISVFVQDDVRKALELLAHRAMPGFRIEFPPSQNGNKNRPKKQKLGRWYVAAILRGLQGLLSLFVSFVLIIQSENVFDLMLNFTAILFLSELDELVFALAMGEYFGSIMKRYAEKVEGTVYYFGVANAGKVRRHLSALMLVLVLLMMYAGFAVTWARQESSEYITCKQDQIHVEFSDVLLPSLGTYTGIYNPMGPKHKLGFRYVYQNEAAGNAKIGFCLDRSVWTFFENSDGDPCNYLARSAETTSFDVMAIESRVWFSQDDDPLEHIEFLCGSPAAVETCQGAFRDGGEGCPTLSVPSAQSIGFSVDTAREFFALGAGIRVHKHPVYWGRRFIDDPRSTVDLIMYTGRRWVLTDTSHFLSLRSAKNATDLEIGFSSVDFHASQLVSGAVAFVTEPVDGYIETCSPVGLSWYHAVYSDEESILSRNNTNNNTIEFPSPDLTRQVNIVLSCSTCNSLNNPCWYDGVCQANGKCVCKNGATGPLCELAPLNDGFCNDYFNTKAYQFDGGDCCGATCESEICGLAALSSAFGTNLNFRSDGFSSCIDDQMVSLNILVDYFGELAHAWDIVEEPPAWEAEMLLECEDIVILKIPFGTYIEYGTNETVYVKDGTHCTFTMDPTHVVRDPVENMRVRIIQDSAGGNGTLLDISIVKVWEPNPLWPKIEGSFSVISKCLRDDLFPTLALPDEVEASQYAALEWINTAPSIDGFECGTSLLKERYALAVLNYASGDNLPESNKWLSPSFHCAAWEGLLCNEDSRVVQLTLRHAGLNGTLPTELGSLRDLRLFKAAGNLLRSTIPAEVWTLRNIEEIDLSGNQLTGSIATEIGKMTRLEGIRLSANYLTGTIPTELGRLTNSTLLQLKGNQ